MATIHCIQVIKQPQTVTATFISCHHSFSLASPSLSLKLDGPCIHVSGRKTGHLQVLVNDEGGRQNVLAASSPGFQLCYSPVVLETFFFFLSLGSNENPSLVAAGFS